MLSSKEILDTMATEMVRRRRHYSAELKEQILLECAQPGASVAKIAMSERPVTPSCAALMPS